MFQSRNPTLQNAAFAKPQTWDDFLGPNVLTKPNVMTLQGTVVKSMVLVAICAISAAACWRFIQSTPGSFMPVMGVGIVGALVLSLIICFKPRTSPYLAPIYALFEGAFVAAASMGWAAYAAGAGRKGNIAATLGTDIILQAGILTLGISAGMLIAYATRVIRPSQKLLGAIAGATLGVVFFSFVSFIVSWFAPGLIHGMWQSPFGLLLAGGIVVLAAFNLVMDFALIENGVKNEQPKYMEWYGGFALLVTIVWLYVSILRLLALLSRRN